jgi:hypothetical protein
MTDATIRENLEPGQAAPDDTVSRPGASGPAALPARAVRSGTAAGSPASRPAPQRPDPRPMRFAVAAGGLATLSALLATISTSALPSSATAVTVPADPVANVAAVQNVTRVVKLPPGVPAPVNAGPNVLVTQLPAPVATPRTVVVTTTQSGKVVKP